MCSDYKVFPNTCRCQYWSAEDPRETLPAACNGYYTGGTIVVSRDHWACCDNCNTPTIIHVIEQHGREEVQSPTVAHVEQTLGGGELSTTSTVEAAVSKASVRTIAVVQFKTSQDFAAGCMDGNS